MSFPTTDFTVEVDGPETLLVDDSPVGTSFAPVDTAEEAAVAVRPPRFYVAVRLVHYGAKPWAYLFDADSRPFDAAAAAAAVTGPLSRPALGCVCSSILDVTTGRPTVTEVLRSGRSDANGGVANQQAGGGDTQRGFHQMGFAKDVAAGVISMANKAVAASTTSDGGAPSSSSASPAVGFVTVSCGVTQQAVLTSSRARMTLAAANAEQLRRLNTTSIASSPK